MAQMVDPDEGDFVVDPACGSGGFLLACMKQVREKVEKRYRGDQGAIDKADWDFSHKHVWGVDINDRIARVAMLGMILNEDGSSNIECQDSFSDFTSFHRSDMFTLNRFDILLTNPPFGGDVFEPKILANFELGSKGNKKRKRQKTEILMLERCLEFLKPGGRMGIVLPDGILTNSSLVFLRKKQYPGQNVGDYPIFMAMVEHVGYDSTGRDDKNELPEVTEAFFGRSGRLGQITDRPLTYQTRYSELNRRWDTQFYTPAALAAEKLLESSRFPVAELSAIVSDIRNGTTPPGGKFATQGIPFIRSQNLSPAGLDLSDVVLVTEEFHKSLSRSRLKPGDVLIAVVGATIGKVSFVPDSLPDANINQNIAKVTLKPEVNPQYVVHFLNSQEGQFQLHRAATTTAKGFLNNQKLRGLKIPLPPRPVQDRIARMMAEAYRERKDKLVKAEELIASIDGYVLERLGIKLPEVEPKRWYTVSYSQLAGRHDPYYYRPEYEAIAVALKSRADIREFGALIEFMSNGIEVRKYVTEGLPYLRVSEMKQRAIDLSLVKLIDLKLSDIPNKIRLNVGDLLISRSGSLGQVALATPDLTNCVISSHIRRVVPNEEAKQNVNLTYLLTFLQTTLCQKQFQQRNNGAVIPEITQEALKTILIPLPPRPLQDEIAAEVTNRREEARRLGQEAEQVVAIARESMERILREES